MSTGEAFPVNGQGLTQSEARSLVARIHSHINDARALVLELYDKEGWRALGYNSWRECVVTEFEQSQSRLYQLLDAAKAEKNISTIVENPGLIRESVLRPLARLEPEQQRQAWGIATAENQKPTAAVVRRAAKTVLCVSPKDLTEREKEELEKSHRQVSTQLFADAVSLFDPRVMTVEALAAHLLRSIDLKETSADLSKPRLERALKVFKTIVAGWK